MQQFLTEQQRLDRFAIPSTPLEHRNFPPQPSSDISVAEADCGSSTAHRSDRMPRCEGSTYTTSSMPTLDNSSLTSLSSPTPSTYYHPQMYKLQEDSSGALYTYQPVSPTVRTGTRPDGTHPCLFSFNGCSEAFGREEDWVAHVDSHFANEIPPPPSCICSVCGEPFSAYDPLLNWGRFLKHTFNDHYVRGGLAHGIPPHPDFVRYCRDRSMISDFTCTRFEGYQAISEDDRTPRSIRNRPQRDADIARVHYPVTWESSEAQPRTTTTVVVNRSVQARDRRS